MLLIYIFYSNVPVAIKYFKMFSVANIYISVLQSLVSSKLPYVCIFWRSMSQIVPLDGTFRHLETLVYVLETCSMIQQGDRLI